MERIGRRAGDPLLLGVQMLLLVLGLAALFSASHYYAERVFQDPYHLLKRQLSFVLIGLAACGLARALRSPWCGKAIPVLLAVAFLLCLAAFVPGLGRPVLGARRWIFLFGQSFEPLELAKLAVVLYLASILAKKQERIDDPFNSLIPPLLVVLAFAGVVYLQKDFSTAVFLLVIALCMFLMAQVRLLYFILLALLFLPLGGLLLFTQAYRVERLIAFFNPLADPAGSGYQMIAARSALVGGGLWGRGLGRGVKSLGVLPEAHSDFIFAVIGEEAGFLGVLFVLFLFLLFAWRGYAVAYRAQDAFTAFLAFGLTTTIFLQALLNFAVVTGLVPSTGIPLPFVSAGGSCLVDQPGHVRAAAEPVPAAGGRLVSDAFFFDATRPRRRPGRSLAARLLAWLVAALGLLAAGLLVFHLVAHPAPAGAQRGADLRPFLEPGRGPARRRPGGGGGILPGGPARGGAAPGGLPAGGPGLRGQVLPGHSAHPPGRPPAAGRPAGPRRPGPGPAPGHRPGRGRVPGRSRADRLGPAPAVRRAVRGGARGPAAARRP